jgi:hypothetical protein
MTKQEHQTMILFVFFLYPKSLRKAHNCAAARHNNNNNNPTQQRQLKNAQGR